MSSSLDHLTVWHHMNECHSVNYHQPHTSLGFISWQEEHSRHGKAFHGGKQEAGRSGMNFGSQESGFGSCLSCCLYLKEASGPLCLTYQMEILTVSFMKHLIYVKYLMQQCPMSSRLCASQLTRRSNTVLCCWGFLWVPCLQESERAPLVLLSLWAPRDTALNWQSLLALVPSYSALTLL